VTKNVPFYTGEGSTDRPMVIKVVHMLQTLVLKKIKDPISIYNHSFPPNFFLKEDEITNQKKITGFFMKIIGLKKIK
jgi:hypothetical protein